MCVCAGDGGTFGKLPVGCGVRNELEYGDTKAQRKVISNDRNAAFVFPCLFLDAAEKLANTLWFQRLANHFFPDFVKDQTTKIRLMAAVIVNIASSVPIIFIYLIFYIQISQDK